jgi:hypothetical protein
MSLRHKRTDGVREKLGSRAHGLPELPRSRAAALRNPTCRDAA